MKHQTLFYQKKVKKYLRLASAADMIGSLRVKCCSLCPHVCFILVLILISMFLRYYTYVTGIFHENQTATSKCPMKLSRTN